MFVSSNYFFLWLAIKTIAKATGKIKPFNEPAKTNNFAGLPKKIKIKVEDTMNKNYKYIFIFCHNFRKSF